MRRLLGFTVVLAALLLATTALAAPSYTVFGTATAKKQGYTPSISAFWSSSRSMAFTFTKTTGKLVNKTQTTQMHSWSFGLNGSGQAPSVHFSPNLGSGHVRAGGKLGGYGSVNLTWTATRPLKVSHRCGGKQTVRTRVGRLDGTVALHVKSGFGKTVKLFHYRATVTKTTGECPPPPLPPPFCPHFVSLSGNRFILNSWSSFANVARQGGRTTASFSASRTIGRAFVSHWLSEAIRNTQFTNSGSGSAHVSIPTSRALYGTLNYTGDSFPNMTCAGTGSSKKTATGGGLTARIFGVGNMRVRASDSWSLDRLAGPRP